ncbi:hypothetical protein HUJ04_010901 [Dendroctonus ponderosae]|nr:hypothetical protein HUJ04_010901 [Dendroctonus ponderosae]
MIEKYHIIWSFNEFDAPCWGKNLSQQKRIYNYRLCRARRYIECTFGILTNKWRILHRPLNVSMQFAENIVKECIILHNFVLVRDGYRHEDTLTYQGLLDIEVTNSENNSSGKLPTTIRDYFAEYFMNIEYFMTTGALSWQHLKI